jgi:hypothetical protein
MVEPGQTNTAPAESALQPPAESKSIDDLFSAVESKQSEAPASIEPLPNLQTNATDFSRPINESPYVTPQYGGTPNVNYPTSPSPDGFWITGIVLGSISLMLACGCGCYGSIPAIALSSIGLVFTYASKSPNRAVCFWLNGLAFGFGVLFLIIVMVIGAIAAMS